ncbi:MAG TPA: HPr kinase/phosphatase C-terminal domain-containing protein, partial [Alphaproteobacteria bacterium]|nr:HPr kinase/phosphatase C-terminal domain-containing protein [Alphaproteobacteria bacterium]
MSDDTFHATSVVFCGHGLLLRGAAGMGKSDLALRLIEAGGVLVADDRTLLKMENGALYAEAPKAIAGLLEIRGLGLRRVPHLPRARMDICLELV